MEYKVEKIQVLVKSLLITLFIFYFSQNVDEEKQHDWYKQMFKSLHKTGKKEGNHIWPPKWSHIIMNWVSRVISKPTSI